MTLNTEFGNIFRRLMFGGIQLRPLERSILRRLVGELPEALKETVTAQFAAYNLAQREVDGRAVNFYRLRFGRVNDGELPRLNTPAVEAPLIRLSFQVPADINEHHAVLTAVHGRAFSITFDRDIRPLADHADCTVTKVVHSWRSNFPLPKAGQAPSRSP